MSSPTKPHFRLAGIYDGRSLCFDLTAGEHSVGSAPGNSVRLPVAGVSRRHAVLDVSSKGLRVEDVGSKNGTFVDGARVLRAAAGGGARLAFGPVELAAESIEPGAALAIRFAPVAPGGSSWADASPSETVLVEVVDLPDSGPDPSATGHAPALELVDALGTTLADGSIVDALGQLVDGLGARGACLVEWSASGEPLAVTTGGEPGDVPTLERLRRRLGEAEPVGGWRVGAWRTDNPRSESPRSGGPPPSRALLGDPSGDVRFAAARFGPGPAAALVVIGAEAADPQLLRVVARQLFAARRGAERRGASRRRIGDVELCFPPGCAAGRRRPSGGRARGWPAPRR
ncbi:MAG: FHA domain-containing protein [Acidobacteriota bacterium]